MGKFFLKSKGFVGTTLGIILYVLHTLFGITPEPVSDMAVDVITLIVLLVGAYGRWVAKEPLTTQVGGK